jgi:hypothetical protein
MFQFTPDFEMADVEMTDVEIYEKKGTKRSRLEEEMNRSCEVLKPIKHFKRVKAQEVIEPSAKRVKLSQNRDKFFKVVKFFKVKEEGGVVITEEVDSQIDALCAWPLPKIPLV